MAISSVSLDESENQCISCGVCESVCPEVFEVTDKMYVKKGVDFNAYEDAVREAAGSCPTSVIKVE